MRDPLSLISLEFRTRENERAAGLTRAQYNELSPGIKAFSDMFAFTPYVTGLNGRAAKGSFVTGNYFEALGVRMAFGRPIEIHDREPVVVLDYRTWVNRFASDPHILSRVVRINDQSYTVIGVADEAYRGIEKLGVDFGRGRCLERADGPGRDCGTARRSASEYSAKMAATAIARRLTADRDRHRQIAR